LDQNAAQATYNEQLGFLQPEFQQQQQQLNDQLSSQGIPVGSQAYQNSMDQFGLQENQAYQTAANSAIANGEQAAQGNFGMALQGQQQNLSQQQAAQAQPINYISALLGQGQQLPTQGAVSPSQTGVSPTNVVGAYGLAQQGNEFGYNAAANQYSQQLGGLGGLAGNAALAYALL